MPGKDRLAFFSVSSLSDGPGPSEPERLMDERHGIRTLSDDGRAVGRGCPSGRCGNPHLKLYAPPPGDPPGDRGGGGDGGRGDGDGDGERRRLPWRGILIGFILAIVAALALHGYSRWSVQGNKPVSDTVIDGAVGYPLPSVPGHPDWKLPATPEEDAALLSGGRPICCCPQECCVWKGGACPCGPDCVAGCPGCPEDCCPDDCACPLEKARKLREAKASIRTAVTWLKGFLAVMVGVGLIVLCLLLSRGGRG